jgi:hypothetical protein
MFEVRGLSMPIIAIRNAADAAPGKVVESNQKAVDALPFDSGTWRVDGVPAFICAAEPRRNRFSFKARPRGAGEGNPGRAVNEKSTGRGHEYVELNEAQGR